MEISVELNKESRIAKVVFAKKDDLNFVTTWRRSIADDTNPKRVDAVDFAQLAVSRFVNHSQIEPYAKSIEDIGDYIGYNKKCEVACCVLLKCDWFPDSEVIGISHFRRTWSNRIILDYLAAHPFTIRPPEGYPYEVHGVGTALLYFVCTVAKRYECDVIWGEATQGSCGFYKKALSLASVEDLIYADRSKYLGFIDSMEKDDREGLNSGATSAREEIYAAEVENPPFVGSKTGVFNPARKLAQRFLGLPNHVQRDIVESIGLVRDKDVNLPDDELFKSCFLRATKAGQLSELWRQVESKYPDGEPDTNPFP